MVEKHNLLAAETTKKGQEAQRSSQDWLSPSPERALSRNQTKNKAVQTQTMAVTQAIPLLLPLKFKETSSQGGPRKSAHGAPPTPVAV